MAEPSDAALSNSFAVVSAVDHSGLLWIASILCAIYSILTASVRWSVKRKLLGLDDWLFGAALIVAVAEYLIVFAGLKHGLAKSTTLQHDDKPIQVDVVGQFLIASRIASLLALSLAKGSVLLLIRRLFAPDMIKRRTACDSLLGIVIVWGVASAVAESAGCSPSQFVGEDIKSCPNEAQRWQGIAAFDVTTELTIVLLSVSVVWSLQLSMSNKLSVIIAFSFRLPVAVLSILHAHFVASSTTSTDRGIAIVRPLVWLNIQLCVSLVSATIPNLKQFIQTFNSNMGMGGAIRESTHVSSHTATKSTDVGDLIPLQPLTSDRSSCVRRQRSEQYLGEDAESQELIIRREVEWEVRYER